jgi:hypothetical protein
VQICSEEKNQAVQGISARIPQTSTLQTKENTMKKALITRQQATGHLEGIGDPGSFRLSGKRGRCTQLIASVQIRKGRREVFIDEVMLRLGGPRAMKSLGIKDYATLKKLLTKKLISLSAISSGSSGGAGSLRWPIKCVFTCPVHHTCENYDWVGFW